MAKKEKILVNFRTFPAYKKGLEKLAESRGVTVTQYLNAMILDRIRSSVTASANIDAKREAGIRYGLPERLVSGWGDRGHTESLEAFLGKERAGECVDFKVDRYFENIRLQLGDLGLGAGDFEYGEIIRTFPAE